MHAAPSVPGAETPPVLVLALGVNVWVTHVLLTLVSGESSPAQQVVGASALLCLPLGVAAHVSASSEFGRRIARWLLLCVFPATLGLSLALGSERVRETAHTPLTMPLSAAALLAYGAAAVWACRAPARLLETEVHPLNGREPQPQAKRLREFLVGGVLIGGLAITVVAPLWPPYAELATGWGDAADSGAVLTALVATATSVSVIVVQLGTALRRSEARSETRAKRRGRIATLLFLTLLGFVTYWTVRQ